MSVRNIPPIPELIAAYQELGTVKKVSERYGAPYDKLRDVLDAAGVEIRPRGRPPGPGKKWAKPKPPPDPYAGLSPAAELIRVYVKLGSIDRVASHYRISRAVVRAELRAGGVDFKHGWGPPE